LLNKAEVVSIMEVDMNKITEEKVASSISFRLSEEQEMIRQMTR